MRRKYWLSPENAIYVLMWLLFFLLPIIIFYLRSFTVTQAEFHWEEVFHIWRWFLIFCLCFIIHNFLLAPLLIKKIRVAYFCSVLVCWQFSSPCQTIFMVPIHTGIVRPFG